MNCELLRDETQKGEGANTMRQPILLPIRPRRYSQGQTNTSASAQALARRRDAGSASYTTRTLDKEMRPPS